MSAKTTGTTHILVRVKCPHCSATGKVDMSRLGNSFTCGQCQQKFHIETQATRKGIREETKKPADPSGADVKIVWDKPTILSKLWDKIPRSAKLTAAGGVGLYLLWSCLGHLLLPGAALPEGLQERAVIALRAVIENDPPTVGRLAYRPQGTDVTELINKLRPVTWAKKTLHEGGISIETQVLSNSRDRQPEKTGNQSIATVVITAKNPASASEPAKEFVTYWNQRTDGLQWCLDIKRTSSAVLAFRK